MHPLQIHRCIVFHSDWGRARKEIARRELELLWRDHRDQFSDANVATFVFRSACRELFAPDDPLWPQLAERARQLIGRATDSRTIARVAWGLARSRCWDPGAWRVIWDAAAHRMPDFSPRDLERLMQAIVRSDRRDPALLAAAAAAAGRCASGFDGHQLCAVAWACARLPLPAAARDAASERLATAARASACRLSSRQAGFLLQSFRLLGHRDFALQQTLAARLRERLDNASGRDIAIAMRGLAIADHIELPLLDGLARRALWLAKRDRLRDDELSHLVAAAAALASQADGFDAPLSRLALRAAAAAGGFRPRQIVRVVAALSAADAMDDALLERLCAVALRRIEGFSAAQLVCLHWAWSRSRYRHDAWLAAAAAALRGQPEALSAPSTLRALATSMATLRHDDPALLRVLSELAAPALARFSGQQIADTAWSMASFPHRDRALAERLSDAANAKWREFDALGLVRLHQAGTMLPLGLGGALRGRIAAALRRRLSERRPAGALASELDSALSRIGVAHRTQQRCDGHVIDLSCTVGGVPLAVECESVRRSRLLSGDGRRRELTGDSRMRERILRRNGYRVLRVSEQGWRRMRTDRARDRWLHRRLLRLAGARCSTRQAPAPSSLLFMYNNRNIV